MTHNPEQQEEFIQLLKYENRLLTTRNNALQRRLDSLQKRFDGAVRDATERKQAIDNISAELSKAKRRLKRYQNKG